MSDITKVYLITGFLGSGKTTFLNRVINTFPKDKKLTILVNEFGEIGIDGTLVEDDDIDMMEISRGSIFCVCVKTDFIKGLYKLNTVICPDILIIESTGVANPADLKKDLQLPIFNNGFRFEEQFCIIDAANFLDAYNAYASLEKQIASSSLFIINKTDISEPEKIEAIKKIICNFHSKPLFFETCYADFPFEKFFDLETKDSASYSKSIQEKADILTPVLTPILTSGQLDQFIDKLLDSPDLEITPPDTLMSVAYKYNGNSIEQIETMAKNLPSSVIRAKGFLNIEEKIYIFNYVMGNFSIKETNVSKKRIKHENILVFIGPPDSMQGIEAAAKSEIWTNIGIFQPMSKQS